MAEVKLNYGLIGCGKAGKVHCYHFSRNGYVKLISIADTDKNSLSQFSDLFKPHSTYSDYNSMLKDEKLDIISIATPPFYHPEQVMAAADKGLHILTEKPIATTIEKAKEMVEYCKRKNVRLGVMLPRRFYNNSRAVKQVLDKKLLGKIKNVEFSLECHKGEDYYKTDWRGKKEFTGGGVLMSQSIHSIDQLVYFFGKAKSVKGKVWTTRDYLEIEDEAEGEILFENGVKVKLRATANSEKLWEGITKIKGEKGEIILDSAEVIKWNVDFPKPKIEEQENVPENIKPGYYGLGHLKVINDFISAIKEHKKPYVTAEDSIEAMRIIIGIYKSSKNKGKEIII